MNEIIKSSLENARSKLIDLSLRNPLINFQARSKKINIVNELSREVFRLLVDEKQTMEFQSISNAQNSDVVDTSHDTIEVSIQSSDTDKDTDTEIVDKDIIEVNIVQPMALPSPNAKKYALKNKQEGLSYQDKSIVISDSSKQLLNQYDKDEFPIDDMGENKEVFTENIDDEPINVSFSEIKDEAKNVKIQTNYYDKLLQTSLTSSSLQSRLVTIHSDAKSFIEDRGVNVLYLALGFLTWSKTEEPDKTYRAPLILIPVTLQRANVQSRFKVSYNEQEVVNNLSLIEMLKADFYIDDFPEFLYADSKTVESYFQVIQSLIENQKNWSVSANEIALGFFSFGKFLMYKDLDSKAWPEGQKPEQHDILSKLLANGFDDEDRNIENKTAADIFLIQDADASQIAALSAVKAGQDMVLRGPPGTGKSQTITNIIADAIGHNQSVLFVAEKLAALEVVKRKLEKVGLGDAVLELHSHKTSKMNFVSELGRILEQNKSAEENTNLFAELKNISYFKKTLDDYCQAVNRRIGQSHYSFINALGQVLTLKKQSETLVTIYSDKMDGWTEDEFVSYKLHVERLDIYLSENGNISDNHFICSHLTDWLASWHDDYKSLLEQMLIINKNLYNDRNHFLNSINISVHNGSIIDEILKVVSDFKSLPELHGIQIQQSKWDKIKEDTLRLVNAAETLTFIQSKHSNLLTKDAWSHHLVDDCRVYISHKDKLFKGFNKEYQHSKAYLEGFFLCPLPETSAELLKIVESIEEYRRYKKVYDGLVSSCAPLLGDLWQGERSDWKQISQWIEQIDKQIALINNTLLAEQIWMALSETYTLVDMDNHLHLLKKQQEKQQEQLSVIVDKLKLMRPGGEPWEWPDAIEKQNEQLLIWLEHLEQLPLMCKYNKIVKELNTCGLHFVLEHAKQWTAERGVLTNSFIYSWYDGLLKQAYNKEESLRAFDGSQHTHAINEFSRLDKLVFEYNRVKLITHHWNNIRQSKNHKNLRIIFRELNKKRNHKAIRHIINEVGNTLKNIKPVFMMSPMSIATYLAPGAIEFDLVIFDEASQVRPEDAYGAIIRARQVVVVGDNKQLPPTQFFEKLVEPDHDDENDFLSDLDSILGLFITQGAPEHMLKWHYRSRHESLITVSNREFYNNELTVFPSALSDSKERGLELTCLPDTIYDRGKSRVNIKEAEFVANVVMVYAKEFPELSLGVVAFSSVQRDAIMIQLESLRRQNTDYETYFDENKYEPVFVKNLENVQGDERDIILISIGYGKDKKGSLSMNFGPLNKEGGERRLNVLISRARLKMAVFANFKAEDLAINHASPKGITSLYAFLNYAEHYREESKMAMKNKPMPHFQKMIANLLEEQGYTIETNIGSAGYFMDIAICNKQTGEYLLGIECDGKNYHHSSTTDRDRLRPLVLKGLGWKLCRIWSVDWYRDENKEKEKFLFLCSQLIQGKNKSNGIESFDMAEI